MNESILITASRLSDDALHARLEALAGAERFASVELIGHLSELDVRNAYLGQGVTSLYSSRHTSRRTIIAPCSRRPRTAPRKKSR